MIACVSALRIPVAVYQAWIVAAMVVLRVFRSGRHGTVELEQHDMMSMLIQILEPSIGRCHQRARAQYVGLVVSHRSEAKQSVVLGIQARIAQTSR